ncbi:MAG: flagellin [Phycisphaerae bacterium]
MLSPISNSTTLGAESALRRNEIGLTRTFQRLATGKRVNAGRDDPAALISSERLAAAIASLEAETQSLRRANQNATIADAHVSEVSSMLGELKALVVATSNDAGMSTAEIQANQIQIDSIVSSVARFTGSAITSLDGFNIPGKAELASQLAAAADGVASLQSGGANDLASGNFDAAVTAVDAAITSVATARGRIGAYQKDTLAPAINASGTSIENLSAAKSQIVDTDFAVETSNLSKFQILTDAGTMLLRLTHQRGQDVLALLA